MYIMPFLNLKYYTGNIIVLFALIFLFNFENHSQNNTPLDTTEIINLIKIAKSNLKCNSDSSIYFSNQALMLIEDTGNELYLQALNLKGLGFLYAVGAFASMIFAWLLKRKDLKKAEV